MLTTVRQHQDCETDQPHTDAGQFENPWTVTGQRAVDADPQRHHGHEERRHPGGHAVQLADRGQAVSAGE